MNLRGAESSVVSGPPLSVGRLRQNSARTPRMYWRGAGLTACIGAFELGGGEPRERPGGEWIATPRLLCEAPSGDPGVDSLRVTRTTQGRRTLMGFFEAGGREIVTLDVPRSAAVGHWIGEDAGPGKRTGVFQLLDLQDVSTILVLGGDGVARERILHIARRRPDKCFLFPVLSPRRPGDVAGARAASGGKRGPSPECVRLLLPNVAEVSPFSDDESSGRRKRPARTREPLEVDALRDLGRLAAMLDETEFSDQPRRYHLPRSAVTRWPPRTPGVLRLMAWRRWEGLRRSIELGSRWTIMELHHPLVWRHVERDVRAFLHRMAEHGLVRGAGRGGFRVRCGPRAPSAGRRGPAVPAVDIRVSVRLTPPYDAALRSVGSHRAADLDASEPEGTRRGEVTEKDRSSSVEEQET